MDDGKGAELYINSIVANRFYVSYLILHPYFQTSGIQISGIKILIVKKLISDRYLEIGEKLYRHEINSSNDLVLPSGGDYW